MTSDNEKEKEATPSCSKRKTDQSIKLIDNKRKHMEKKLTSAQRDQILIADGAAEKKFRQDMLDAMNQSNDAFVTSMNTFTQTMQTSMAMLANALSGSLANNANSSRR